MKIFKPFLAIAIMLIVFASCKKSSDTLTNAIPASAIGVYHVDVQSLVTKANYDIFRNETVQRGINLAKGMLGKPEAVDMIDALTKDVNAMGLNLKGNCYIYMDGKTVGIVLGVNDAAKFENALLNFSLPAEAIEKENGINIFGLDDRAILVWSEEKLLLLAKMNMGNDSGELDLKAAALKQIAQSADESINSVPAFAKFLEEKKDISFFYTLGDSYFDLFRSMPGGSELPEEITGALEELKGASSAAFVSFENGEIVSTSKSYYPDSEAEKKYKDFANQMMGELKGEQLKLVPGNAIFAASANLKGAGVYDVLGQFGLQSLIEKEDTTGMVKTILNELEGDATFALTDIANVKKSYEMYDGTTSEYDSTEPQFMFMVDTKDGNKALGIIKDFLQQKGDSLVEIAPATYSIDETFLSVKGNTLFITNNQAAFENQPAVTALSELAKGKLMVLGGDIKPLKEIAAKNIPDETAAPIVDKFISLFDTYEMTGTSTLAEGKIVMTDNSQNSLAAICQWLDATLTSLNGQIPF